MRYCIASFGWINRETRGLEGNCISHRFFNAEKSHSTSCQLLNTHQIYTVINYKNTVAGKIVAYLEKSQGFMFLVLLLEKMLGALLSF